MRRALTHIRQLTRSRVCAIYEYQRDRDAFRCTRALGDPSELLTGLVIANGDRITGWAGGNREMAVNSDAVLDLGPLAELFDPPLRRAISCPIQLGGQTSAVLTVYCDCEEGFSESHVAALEEATATIALRLKARQESVVLI
jgi:GAF domain-containing protein